jgi:hypothetical protein
VRYQTQYLHPHLRPGAFPGTDAPEEGRTVLVVTHEMIFARDVLTPF